MAAGFRRNVWIIVLVLVLSGGLGAMTVPEKVKDIVAFIYVKGSDGKFVPNGTAFFVGVKDLRDPNRFWVYLVSARHVLSEDEGGTYVPAVYIRLDKLEGGTEVLDIPVVLSGEKQTVFVHPDPSVDLVAIPVKPDRTKYLFRFLPEAMITTREQFKALKITEGSEIFFTGLFLPHMGESRNLPIFRFGRVALVSPEKVDWNGEKVDLYLIESSSYGGNSGSPVFFYLDSGREPGAGAAAPPVLFLAGVIKGAFQDVKPVQVVDNSRIALSISNVGISAVVPAYKLQELLHTPELEKRRSGQ